MKKYCSNPECPGRQQNDKPKEHDDNVGVCPECGADLAPSEPPADKPSTSPWTKAFVTLGVLAVCLGARQIALPTITPNLGFSDGAMGVWSIMALGVKPLLIGYVLVEFAALVVPEWRPLRVGGPAGRAKLHQASLIVGMVLALGQAAAFTLFLESTGVARNYGAGFRVITVLTLLGATGALVALARIVDREGLGSGFAILLLADLVPQIVRPLGSALWGAQMGEVPFSVLFNGVLVTAVLVGATLWMFSPFRLPAGEGLPHPSLVSRPACGVAPFTVVPAVLAFATAWISLKLGRALSLHLQEYFPATLLLNTGATVLLAFLFNHPDRIAESWRSLSPNPPEGIPRLKAVMLECILFVVLVVLVEEWAIRQIGVHAPSAVAILFATAILCDLVREWRAREGDPHLAPIWEIHQMYALAPALRLLEAEEIRAFPKGMRLRSLLQFFGPYVPVQILVPEKDAQRAHALLQARWPRDVGVWLW